METVKRYNAVIALVLATLAISGQGWAYKASLDRRFDALEKRLEKALEHVWTVDMQNHWAFQVAGENTNNWIPNPYSIWQSVRDGEVPPRMRITVGQGRNYE